MLNLQNSHRCLIGQLRLSRRNHGNRKTNLHNCDGDVHELVANLVGERD